MTTKALEHIKPQKLVKPTRLSEEELAGISQFDSNLVNQMALWANKKLSCVHCKRCTLRCEVLKDPNLDIGLIEEDYQRIMALSPDQHAEATVHVVQSRPELYNALRRCCFCGYCTTTCQTHVLGADRMRDWRELFSQARIMPPEDSKIVMVDNEWHIFSAYRAIYGVDYSEFVSLEWAAEQGPGTVDTLLFPGCSLYSYAPELTKTVGNYLSESGVSWAITSDCCGSPLMSAGLFDRAQALRDKIREQALAAGIKRVITVCPGCGEEIAEVMGDDIEIIPLPEALLRLSEERSQNGELPGFSPLDIPSLTFFDSCHDRYDGRHGRAIRQLMSTYLPKVPHREIEHSRKAALCCGAGGAVASYDPDITQRRVWRVINEARRTNAHTLVTMCPTCTYTIGQACLQADYSRGTIDSHHYLEILFGQPIDWATIFAQLESMWSGEYGPWLNETFFS